PREDHRRGPAVGDPAARHVACGERGEKYADQAPPHIDGVAEDRRDDPAGDNLQRQQHCAADKNGDFENRSLPVSLPSLPGLPGLPGLHTYNLWGSVLQTNMHWHETGETG